jgi:hypothetical protein
MLYRLSYASSWGPPFQACSSPVPFLMSGTIFKVITMAEQVQPDWHQDIWGPVRRIFDFSDSFSHTLTARKK